jgi:transcriptional regulator with XRE-family HTH domain
MLASDFYPLRQKEQICQNAFMDADKFVARLKAKIEADERLTPSGLARKAGIDNSTIRKLISGDNVSPRIATAEKICAAMGTTLRDFMADPPDPLRQEIVDLYNQLEPSERRLLVAAARGMLARDREEG